MAIRSRALVCALFAVLVVALIVAAPAAGKGKPTQTTEFGNNLSVPVIFAEGYSIVGGDVSDPGIGSGFRSTPLVDNFDALTAYTPLQFLGLVDPETGEVVDLAGNPLLSNWFYEQKTEAAWQAEWADATTETSALSPVDVTRLDWGDSLLSKAWTVRSKIRLEVRLYRTNDLTGSDGSAGLKGYGMNHLSGAGLDEVWGAADASALGAVEPSREPYIVTPTETTVYSNCARLSLYRISALYGDIIDYDNDPENGTETPVFSLPVADKYGTDGPGGFGAEVNVGGNVIYGYTLDAKALRLPAGYYRVMFSLDPTAAWGGITVTRNAVISALDVTDSVRDGYDRIRVAVQVRDERRRHRLLGGHRDQAEVSGITPSTVPT